MVIMSLLLKKNLSDFLRKYVPCLSPKSTTKNQLYQGCGISLLGFQGNNIIGYLPKGQTNEEYNTNQLQQLQEKICIERPGKRCSSIITMNLFTHLQL